MKSVVGAFLVALLCSVAAGAFADTEQLDAIGYNVVTKLGEKTKLANGDVVLVGGEGHASIVNSKTGEQTSQYCNIDTWVDANDVQTGGVGHCSVFYDSGDVAWVSVAQTTVDQPVTWTVIGGTGKYAGATGGGMSKVVSTRGDGYASTYEISGKIVTK